MKRIEWAYCAFYIFCICGCIGIFPDMDHIWDIFGLQAPINFSGWNSRPFHVPLLFILAGIVISGIITAFIYGSSKLRQCLELLDKRIERRISPDKRLFSDDLDYIVSNNSMVVVEIFGIPNQGMSYPVLQDGLDYTRLLRGILKVYRQTTLEEFGIGE